MLNSIRNVFGGRAQIDGCFYHLCQSTWRHINELGLTNLYENSDDVKKAVGMMDGLAFLPLQHVNAGAVIVRNKMLQVNAALLPLLNYFLQTYVGVWVPPPPPLNNNQMIFQPPLFPPATWNVYDLTLQGGDRTNNIYARGGITPSKS